MIDPFGNMPWMIHRMAILQMSVADLSSELQRCAAEMPELSFKTYAAGTFVSDEVDVIVTRNESDVSVQIAEPLCGDPVFTPHADDTVERLRVFDYLIESIAYRRSLLKQVIDAFFVLLPEFPAIEKQIRMSELARQCDVHITTVSRALDNKICETPIGPLALRSFLARLA